MSRDRSALGIRCAVCTVIMFGSGFLFTLLAQASPVFPMTIETAPVFETPAMLYLPLVQNEQVAVETPTAPDPRQWDARLDQRGAVLEEATVAPGEGYWRLVSARWYDEVESGGRHNIYVDLLDEAGQRVVNVPVRFYWNHDHHIVHTEAKPGEAYAANYPMSVVAPAYGAVPHNGAPADRVWGMGLGSIELPYHTIHSSYGLVWQWSHYPATPEPTATPTPMPTTPAAQETQTPTPTPTTTTEPDLLFQRAELVRCDANAGITYVQGTVRLNGEPANGYRVVFSYAPDGSIVAGITSGPHPGYEGWNPGYYSHILLAWGPREGDWWFWIIDEQDQRISKMAYVHTHGVAGDGRCQQAQIDFDSQ